MSEAYPSGLSDPGAVRGKFRRTAAAYDTALILLIRGRHICHRIGNKHGSLRCRVNFAMPGARYSCNARLRLGLVHARGQRL
jgi:hypothetical protein